MHDAVADVLREREALDRGAGGALALSIVLHAGLTALGLWAAMRVVPPKAATMVSIRFATVSARTATPRSTAPRPVAAKPAPKIAEPQPRIEEPRPAVAKPATKPEKGTVPFSSYGRSSKKGSETPPAPVRQAPASPAGTATAADVPIGGAGVTGLEGGDFPYSLYIDGMQRRIGTNWFRPRVTAGTTAVVYFRILRNGAITDARIETPSGNGTFDRAALSAVRGSSPLTPLPFAYSGTYLGVHLTFK